MNTDSFGRRIIRYTIQIHLEPSGQTVEYRVVTSLGELKAAAMATLRLRADDPEARLGSIEVVNREAEFQIDQARDILDYWGGVD